MPEYLTAQEVAAALKMKPNTILDMARANQIPRVKLSRRVVRFHLADVVAAMEERAKWQK